MRHWHVDPDWIGEDVFVVGGGPSVDYDEVQKLRRRDKTRVVVINSSYAVAPWADLLFFADERWWTRELTEGRLPAIERFEGVIATNSWKVHHPRLHHLKRATPPGLAKDRGTVALQYTSVTGVLNICLHARASRVILLGIDGRDSPEGRAHHHAEYPWPRGDNTYSTKETEFASVAGDLAAAGVRVFNASPVTDSKVWPKALLADFI